MTDFPIPEKHRSDVLFLLIGTNPLPNYIAARLLTQQGATVYLLHSEGQEIKSTKPIAEQIEAHLGDTRSDLTVVVKGISENSDLEIKDALEPLLRKIARQKPSSRVGLHYTGGTKPMAVHTYRLIEKLHREDHCFADVIFSYLDPRRFALRMDGQGTATGTPLFYLSKEAALLKATEMTMDSLAALHGYEQDLSQDDWATAAQTPGLLGVCRAIAQNWESLDSVQLWLNWIRSKPLATLPDGKPNSRLRAVRAALDEMCGGPDAATPAHVAKLLRPRHEKAELSSCKLWFDGLWLEELADDAVGRLAGALPIKPAPLRCRYKASGGDFFELDAAFMFGYQLFAVSCIATDRKDRAKEHLFEAFVRARQLGGDEARVGLVCCMNDTEALRKEIERTWDAEGKIRVFDRRQLGDLPKAFKEWVNTANPNEERRS